MDGESNGEIIGEIHQDIEQNSRHLGLNFVGFVHLGEDSEGMEQSTGISNLGHYKFMGKLMDELGIEQVILAIEATDHQHLEDDAVL